MGPLLFNIFINDIVNASSVFDLIMYADDTTLISTLETFGNHKKSINIDNNINTEILKITTWLKSNMLELNVEKSKFMIFFKHPKIITNFRITINNSTIEQVDHFNFLGLTLDQNITWNPHVDKVSIKISRVTSLLRKLQHYFPKHILITIYNSLIHSHLMYGLPVWGFQSMRVEKLQKKAIRVLANRPYTSHATPIFTELRILKITDLYHVQLYKLHYKHIHNLLPRYFAQFLNMYGDHNYDFRNVYFRLPMTKGEFVVQSTKYQYSKLIRENNQSDLDSRCTVPISQFMYHIKSNVINEYNPVCNIAHCYICMNT